MWATQVDKLLSSPISPTHRQQVFWHVSCISCINKLFTLFMLAWSQLTSFRWALHEQTFYQLSLSLICSQQANLACLSCTQTFCQVPHSLTLNKFIAHLLYKQTFYLAYSLTHIWKVFSVSLKYTNVLLYEVSHSLAVDKFIARLLHTI